MFLLSSGGWSQEGCLVLAENNTHCSCTCSHLTAFVVLLPLPTPSPPVSLVGPHPPSYLSIHCTSHAFHPPPPLSSSLLLSPPPSQPLPVPPPDHYTLKLFTYIVLGLISLLLLIALLLAVLLLYFSRYPHPTHTQLIYSGSCVLAYCLVPSLSPSSSLPSPPSPAVSVCRKPSICNWCLLSFSPH